MQLRLAQAVVRLPGVWAWQHDVASPVSAEEELCAETGRAMVGLGTFGVLLVRAWAVISPAQRGGSADLAS